MMQVVENWAKVVGIVQGATRDAGMPDHAHVRLHLTDSENVGALPNLFRQRVGEDIDLFVRDEAHQLALAPGARIAVRARVAAPNRAFSSASDLTVLA